MKPRSFVGEVLAHLMTLAHRLVMEGHEVRWEEMK